MNLKKNTVSLEDLLRVKRAERPRAEFWLEFERELRAKQLAAIVEPRPWWAPFIRTGSRVLRYQLPVGAAAVLALSFVVLTDHQAPAPATEIAAPAVYAEAMAASTLAIPAPSVAQIEAISAETTGAMDAPAVAASGRSAHTVPLLNPEPATVEPSPSARYIAANLAALQADNPGLMEGLFGTSAVSRVETREPVRDPLSQMSVPGESRRSRLLATALPAMAGSADVAVGDSGRVARRLTEERLYDSISRIGVKGDRVAFKF